MPSPNISVNVDADADIPRCMYANGTTKFCTFSHTTKANTRTMGEINASVTNKVTPNIAITIFACPAVEKSPTVSPAITILRMLDSFRPTIRWFQVLFTTLTPFSCYPPKQESSLIYSMTACPRVYDPSILSIPKLSSQFYV